MAVNGGHAGTKKGPQLGPCNIDCLEKRFITIHFRVARLQKDFLREIVLLSYELSYEECSEMFEPLCCGSTKSSKIPDKILTQFPCKKYHRRASAGAQGEQY